MCSSTIFIRGYVFVYTVLKPLMYNVEGVCTSLGTEMFELPKFIFPKPATAWTSEERFAAETLLSMNHRWPSLVDYEMIKFKFFDKKNKFTYLVQKLNTRLSIILQRLSTILGSKKVFSIFHHKQFTQRVRHPSAW